MLRLALLSQLVAIALGAIGPKSTLHIANKNIQPDGFERSTVLAGAGPDSLSFPGPVIEAFKGTNSDAFALNVVDDLKDKTMLRTTSIHWHGFLQSGSAWADGPAGVTQCPIVPGNNFEYQFSAARQAGTFWYHSHDRSQYCDGLRGAMVVYDENDPHLKALRYDVDNEDTIITLADWYHVPGPILENAAAQRPNSTLINGRGRYAGGPAVPLTVIAVQPNKRYRFRVVSISCSPFFTFSIDGHEMTVIEADGESTKPLVVDSIQIHAGQRYSVIVNATQPIGNYWVRSNPNRGTTGFAGGLNLAILRYEGADAIDPSEKPEENIPPSVKPLLEANLRPWEDPVGISGDPDVKLQLNIEFGSGTFKVNGTSFHEPKEPVLLQIKNANEKNETVELFEPKGSVYTLPRGKLIELTMPAPSANTGNPHPMHLHGHVFSVVRSAGSDIVNTENPVQRDVVNLGSATTDRVIIRFRTDNPGPWILHCHVDWHLVHGLAIVFAEDVPNVPAPAANSAWGELCAKYDKFIESGE